MGDVFLSLKAREQAEILQTVAIRSGQRAIDAVTI